MTSTCLQKKQPKPYGAGMHTTETYPPGEEIPQLSTLQRGTDEPLVSFSTAGNLPEAITLRFSLEAVPLKDNGAMAQMSHDGQQHTACPVYNIDSYQKSSGELFSQSLWSGINISFEGTAFYKQKGEMHFLTSENPAGLVFPFQKGKTVHLYRFHIAERSRYHQTQHTFRGKHWILDAPPEMQGLNLVPLIPFGGFVPEVLDVTRICQSYAVIVNGGMFTTQLCLYTQLMCNAKRILISSSRRKTDYRIWSPYPFPEEITLSLGGWLMKGGFEIQLYNSSMDDRFIYQSLDFLQSDIGSALIDITFVPKK